MFFRTQPTYEHSYLCSIFTLSRTCLTSALVIDGGWSCCLTHDQPRCFHALGVAVPLQSQLRSLCLLDASFLACMLPFHPTNRQRFWLKIALTPQFIQAFWLSNDVTVIWWRSPGDRLHASNWSVTFQPPLMFLGFLSSLNLNLTYCQTGTFVLRF